MKGHDGDITPGMNSYYGDDGAAELEAIEIMKAHQATVPEPNLDACVKPGCTGSIVPEAFAMHISGSGVWCQKHLEEHHGKPLAEIFEAKRRANAVVHYCARCGKRGHWVSGAGQALCSRHEDDY